MRSLKLVSYVLDKQVDLCYAWSRIHSLDKSFYNNLKSANEKINKYLKENDYMKKCLTIEDLKERIGNQFLWLAHFIENGEC